MNFIDYCIATKNYSTLKAIKDYTEVKSFSNKATKSFGTKKENLKKGAKIAGIGAGAAALAAEGKYLYDANNESGWDKAGRIAEMKTTEDPGIYNKFMDTMDRWHGRLNSESTAKDYLEAAKDKGHDIYEDTKHKGIKWLVDKGKKLTGGSKDEEPEPEPKTKVEEMDDAVRQYMVEKGIANHMDDDND